MERRASGWHFWGVVVAVAFRGPYGPETGYDPRDSAASRGVLFSQRGGGYSVPGGDRLKLG